MNREEFLALYKKHLAGKCSAEEKQQMEAFQDQMTLPSGEWDNSLGSKKNIRKNIHAKINQTLEIDQLKTPRKFNWLKIAAMLFIICSCSILIWKTRQLPPKNRSFVAVANKNNSILPGSNKAFLQTSNGKIIDLSNAGNGTLAVQSGAKINKNKSGLIVYQHTTTKTLAKDEVNQVITPRGGQYQIVLSDGTRVWLNSATTLKYPPVFSGKERKVVLTGEAYFEVAKNKAMPFKVSANGMDVQVLGTHFNVSGYREDNNVRTTLLEGSVKLSNRSGELAMLKPGQQGTLINNDAKFSIKNTDVENAVAWKNGFIAFDHENIQTIMKEISRWYDVDVIFQGNVTGKIFGGTVSRFKDVDEVLKTLELTGSIHFKTVGRRITVMP
jgi:transmembrane sensor